MKNITEKLGKLLNKISEGTHLDKKMLVAVLLLVTGAAALVFSETAESRKAAVTEAAVTEKNGTDEYVDDLENRLTSMISMIEGAGETRVMITLESGSEEIYLHDYDYGENNDPGGKNSLERKDEYVIIDGGSGEEGIVVRVAEPKIRGVAVVCKGADSETVRSRIVETVTALLDISSARVSVAKMS
ncbi:MAG: hypothetical protein IJE48_05105 [Clostridia bacterium]|nr:hypothetical protein [Clostridia bacterium]